MPKFFAQDLKGGQFYLNRLLLHLTGLQLRHQLLSKIKTQQKIIRFLEDRQPECSFYDNISEGPDQEAAVQMQGEFKWQTLVRNSIDFLDCHHCVAFQKVECGHMIYTGLQGKHKTLARDGQ